MEKLRTLCAEAPDELHNVVITLKKPKDQIQLERLGLADAEPIPYQDYMLRSVVPGSKILDLQKETDIEEVTEDSDFEAH